MIISESTNTNSGTRTIILRDSSGERTPALKKVEEVLISQALTIANGNHGGGHAPWNKSFCTQ